MHHKTCSQNKGKQIITIIIKKKKSKQTNNASNTGPDWLMRLLLSGSQMVWCAPTPSPLRYGAGLKTHSYKTNNNNNKTKKTKTKTEEQCVSQITSDSLIPPPFLFNYYLFRKKCINLVGP